jgi:hypothetical protein
MTTLVAGVAIETAANQMRWDGGRVVGVTDG